MEKIFLKNLNLKPIPPKMEHTDASPWEKRQVPYEVAAIYSALDREALNYPEFHVSANFNHDEGTCKLMGIRKADFDLQERFDRIKAIAEKRGWKALKNFFN